MQNIFAKITDEYNHLKTIDRVHYEIHEGCFFSHTVSTTVIATSTYFVVLENSATNYAHAQFMVTASASLDAALYESPTAASTWSAETVYNHFRASTNAATLTIRKNVPSSDITSTGTLLESITVGSGSNPANMIGGSANSRSEWILNKGTKYLVKLNSASTNTITFATHWYED